MYTTRTLKECSFCLLNAKKKFFAHQENSKKIIIKKQQIFTKINYNFAILM